MSGFAIVDGVEPLHPVEVRVLGSLLEKDLATPEYYPLTLSALINACNQKSSRDPVVQYDEATVIEGLALLRNRGWASRITGAGHRVEKFSHLLGERLNLGRRELAVMCVLMLRGPQTVGEIRGRTERMHPFEDMEQVERVLEQLASIDPPLVQVLPRGRWAHALSGDVDPGAFSGEHAAGGVSSSTSQLEERVAILERELATLKDQMIEFRRQFE